MPLSQNINLITPELFLEEFDPVVIFWYDPAGEPVSLPLSKIIHLLFWGGTGSGKTVFLLQLFFQILYKTNPKSLQLLLIDPLRVSFKDFKELPHLLAPVASTTQEAIKVVERMMEANRERYTFLEGVGFENIYDYNKALVKDKIPYRKDGQKIFTSLSKIPQSYIDKKKTENHTLGEPIGQIVFFMDEMNALMLDPEFWGKKPEEASAPIVKDLIGVSEQARKAGIIMIIWTQKISAKTVPTAIRENMKTRICLKVDSMMASRTILWDSPANKSQWAKLAGLGDGLAFNLALSSEEAFRFQSSYVSEEDMITAVNGFTKTYGTNDFDYIQVNEDYAKSMDDLEIAPIDPELFMENMPDILIVSDSVFMKSEYQKLISHLIRNPVSWDIKEIGLSFPSMAAKNLKVVTHQLTSAKILGMNINEEDEKDKNNGDFGLNLKLPGLGIICKEHWEFIESPREWNTESPAFQADLMKLILLRLNKMYIPKAKGLSSDISEYL